MWQTVNVSDAGDGVPAQREGEPALGRGRLRPHASPTTRQVTITLGSAGDGIVTWYRLGQKITYQGEAAFAVAAGDEYELSVLGPDGSLDITVDSRPVLALLDESFGTPRIRRPRVAGRHRRLRVR